MRNMMIMGIAFFAISITGTSVRELATKRFTPIGGVTKPIARLTTITTPKWMGLTPTAVTIGSRIGERIQHCGIDIGIGGASDLILAIPFITGVNDVGPMLEFQLLAVGAELVVTVQHQNVLNNQTICSIRIGVFANLIGPGRGPPDKLQILINTVYNLTPAGFVQAEQDVSILVLVGSLDGSGITGDNTVIIQRDGESCVLGLVN